VTVHGVAARTPARLDGLRGLFSDKFFWFGYKLEGPNRAGKTSGQCVSNPRSTSWSCVALSRMLDRLVKHLSGSLSIDYLAEKEKSLVGFAAIPLVRYAEIFWYYV
jgi:hypothetical protein